MAARTASVPLPGVSGAAAEKAKTVLEQLKDLYERSIKVRASRGAR